MSTRLARLAITTVAGVTIATAAACGSDGEDAGRDDRLAVVTSTNVWGAVATAVGGAEVAVTSIVSDPAADPHSYEVTAKDAATLQGAALVVRNGGGYDDFVEQALGEAEAPVVTAFEVHEKTTHDSGAEEDPAAPSGEAAPSEEAGHAPGDEHGHEHAENEHVWYDLHTVAAVADEIATRLGELRPAAQATFTANAAQFREQVEGLEQQVEVLVSTHQGAAVASTEPVAALLLEEAGLEDVTPAEFLEAIEEETDPSAGAVAEMQALVDGRQVAVLISNPQTETPVVADLVTKAGAAGVPVVSMTETITDGQDYAVWMEAQVSALAAALAEAQG